MSDLIKIIHDLQDRVEALESKMDQVFPEYSTAYTAYTAADAARDGILMEGNSDD